MAEGSIDGVEGAESVFGQIGKVSWSEHTNG
jgi:hypothetical protein